MPGNNHYPQILSVTHILEGVDMDLLNQQAQRVVLIPDAHRQWPGLFERIKVPVYAYLHMTGTYTDIPESETDSFRAKVRQSLEAADILSGVIYGDNEHVELDWSGAFADILIDRLIDEAAKNTRAFSGIFMDNCYAEYAWLTKDPADDARWDTFKREVLMRLKRTFPDLPIIVNNSPAGAPVSGRMVEGVPGKVDWAEALLHWTAERISTRPVEVIFHGSTAEDTARLLPLSMLLGVTCSPRTDPARQAGIISPENLGKWQPLSSLQVQRDGGGWSYTRQFRHVETKRRGLAHVKFDQHYTTITEMRLPWE